MTNIEAWPKPTGKPKKIPERIKRPADWGFESAWMQLETQLGTIEAYNRMVEMCERVKLKIDRGGAVAQNPIYAKSPKG